MTHVQPNESFLALPGRARVAPGDLVGDGGEARVCAVSKTKVAKLHHKSALANGKRAALQRKVAHLTRLGAAARTNTALASVVWPEASLFDARGHFVGYVMPRVARGKTLHLVLRDLSWKLRDRVSVALQLARTFGALHSIGVAVGDPSSNNVLVAKRPGGPSVWLIDADSFHLKEFPCLMGTPRYLLPRVVQGKEAFAAGRDADHHALAFLIFELLLGGLSPYAHKGGGAPEENTAKEFFALVQDENLVPDGPWALRWKALPKPIQDLFVQAFVPGRGPRPTASEWTVLLSSISVPDIWPDLQAKPVAMAAAAATSTKRRLFDFIFFWRKTA